MSYSPRNELIESVVLRARLSRAPYPVLGRSGVLI
jgi:hypothetical protein